MDILVIVVVDHGVLVFVSCRIGSILVTVDLRIHFKRVLSGVLRLELALFGAEQRALHGNIMVLESLHHLDDIHLTFEFGPACQVQKVELFESVNTLLVAAEHAGQARAQTVPNAGPVVAAEEVFHAQAGAVFEPDGDFSAF